MDEHLVFMINAPRCLQLNGIKSKYKKIVAEIIQMDINDLTEMPLQPYYRIGDTTVGHKFSDDDIATIEKVRPFQLLCKTQLDIRSFKLVC